MLDGHERRRATRLSSTYAASFVRCIRWFPRKPSVKGFDFFLSDYAVLLAFAMTLEHARILLVVTPGSRRGRPHERASARMSHSLCPMAGQSCDPRDLRAIDMFHNGGVRPCPPALCLRPLPFSRTWGVLSRLASPIRPPHSCSGSSNRGLSRCASYVT